MTRRVAGWILLTTLVVVELHFGVVIAAFHTGRLGPTWIHVAALAGDVAAAVAITRWVTRSVDTRD
jgi:hypothetical protein